MPALVWLGPLHADGGRVDLAEPLLTKAVSLDPRSAAALFELGKLALAGGDPARAATHLEAALAADPVADGVHYALAMAYRARGDEQRAASHVRRWRDERLYPADPLMEEITDLLKTAVVYEIRGTQAMDDRKWAEAAALFREGLAVAPRDVTLHQNLARPVSRRRPRGAEAEFETAASLLPGCARALFSLGIIMEERGAGIKAIERFSELASDPSMVNARASLADAAAPIGQARGLDCRIRLGRQGRSVREPGAVWSRHGAGPASPLGARPARCSRRRRGRIRNSPASRSPRAPAGVSARRCGS